MRLTRRAEILDRDKLVETFVDAGPLMTLLSSQDHQILYGRRGTGKTHALNFLLEQGRNAGDATVYVDLRQIGSTGGLYNDASIP
jgi:Cdc6-like AAA superfamily ATPase